jgi:hypothetical protein
MKYTIAEQIIIFSIFWFESHLMLKIEQNVIIYTVY